MAPTFAAVAVMIAAFVISDAASNGSPLVHLYFIPRDGWLTTYFIIYNLTLPALLWTFVYGVSQLDRHTFNLMYRFAVFVALAACMIHFVDIFAPTCEYLDPDGGIKAIRLTDPIGISIAASWTLCYSCTILMSIEASFSWLKRTANAR